MTGAEDTAIALDLSAALTDRDGSETLSVSLRGLPAGATLSAGSRQADGSWSLLPGELAGLTLTPPQKFAGNIDLTFSAISTEARGGSSVTATAAFPVRVEPRANSALITAGGDGVEDNWIAIRGTLATTDVDGSEQLGNTITVANVPAGAMLSHGTQVSAGTWSVPRSVFEAGHLAILPPANSDAGITLRIGVQTIDGTSVATTEANATVVVRAVADAPTVQVADATGNEDTAIRLAGVGAALTDTDGSETLALVIAGVPAGAVLSAGTPNADGTWTVPSASLPTLSLTPPRDFSGSINLTLRATSSDNDSSTATIAGFVARIDAVADAPTLRVGAAVGREDEVIALRVSGATTDNDGSERLVGFRLLGVPEGATVRAGGAVLARLADGSVVVEAATAPTLSITPPPGSHRDFTLRVTAIAEDLNGSRAESAPRDLPVYLEAAADVPVWLRVGADGQEDTPIPLNLAARLANTGGSEMLSFAVSGLPAGAALTRGTYRGPGSWSLTAEEAAVAAIVPPRDFAGTLNLTVTAVAQERDGGSQAVSTVSFPVRVAAVVDTGDWTAGATDAEDSPIAVSLAPPLRDADGSERLVGTALVEGVPAGAVLRLADGSLAEGADGTFRIPVERLAGVTLTMPRDSDVAAQLRITVTVEDTGGVRAEARSTVTVDPMGVADMPVLALPGAGGAGHASQDPSAGWVPLNISASLVDGDGSETLHLWVRDVPQGAVLSAGIPAGDGLWRVPATAVSDLALRPVADYQGSFTLRVTAIAAEREGDQAVRTENLAVTIAAPPASVTGGSGAGATDPDVASWTTAPVPSTAPAGFQATQMRQVRDLSGGAGSDTLTGHAGETRLWGDAGDDVLQGNGDNTRAAGDGHDEMYGGSGNDTLVFTTKADLLNTRKIYGDSGFDTIRLLDGVTSIVSADFTSNSRDVQGVERIEFMTSSTASLTVGAGFHAAFGASAAIEATSSAAFSLNAAETNQALTVVTGAGADTLLAGSGNDLLDGGAGSDSISAGAGADTIYGGAGSDRIDGGTGIDRLIYRGNRGDYVVAVLTNDSEGFAYTVTSKGGSVDRIRNVEFLDFADRTGQAVSSLAADDAPRVLLAQAPVLQVQDAGTGEDQGVLLNITAALADSDGGRETLGIRIDGVPAGAKLSAGERDPLTDAWVLRPEELAGLRLMPPADFDGGITLTVRAISAEATGDLATTSAMLRLDVTAVADRAVIVASPEVGSEEQLVPLNLSITSADRDGSERVVSITLSDLPHGAAIVPAAGVRDNGDGTWTVAPEAAGDVRIAPPPGAHGTLWLTVTATTQEASNSATATVSRNISFAAARVPSAPLADAKVITFETLALGDGAEAPIPSGYEGLNWKQGGAYNPTGSLGYTTSSGNMLAFVGEMDGTERDGYEGIAGSPLTITRAGGGDFSVFGADFSSARTDDLPITVRAWDDGAVVGEIVVKADQFSADHFNFEGKDQRFTSVDRVEFISSEYFGLDNLTMKFTDEAPVVSDAVTGLATEVAASDAAGHEDQPIPLALSAVLVDRDGSAALSVVISGLPEGTRLSAGINNGDGSWTLAPDQLTGLSVTPPRDWSGSMALIMQAHARERSTGQVATTSVAFRVAVDGVADAPLVDAATAAQGREDTSIPLDIVARLTDTDGSESLVLVATGVPAGARFSAGSANPDGSWSIPSSALPTLTFTPPQNYSGTLQLDFAAAARETDGDTAAIHFQVVVTVDPVADAPIVAVTNVIGREDHWVALNLSAALTDTHGLETFAAIRIGGLPEGFALSAGTAEGGGSWSLRPADLAGLRLSPPPDWNGMMSLTLTATSQDGASTATTSRDFTVSLAPVNDAPVLMLGAPQGAAAGQGWAAAVGGAQIWNVDGATMGGATMSLSGAQGGDRLILDGFETREVAGRTLVGDTGIEVTRAADGSLTLTGAAPSATYERVIGALTLETTAPGGFGAGVRSIGITLRDETGAAAATQVVSLAVDPSVIRGGNEDATLSGTAGHDTFMGGAGNEFMMGGAGADLIIAPMSGGHDTVDGGSGSWIDTVKVEGAGAPGQGGWTLIVDSGTAVNAADHAFSFAEPASGHIQFSDGSELEFRNIERVTW
ncbi:tandem-95 repeat protein [Roseomonas sp. GCM10028921]